MIAPIIFHLFLNSIGNVVIDDNHLTTIVFNERVERVHSGATASELYLKKSSNGKMIFLKSNGKDLDTNLSVPTVSGKLYMFNIRRGSKPHSMIQVQDGQLDTVFRNVYSHKSITVMEGNHTLKVTNDRKSAVKVNGEPLGPSQTIMLPKGPTIYLNGKRFYK